MYILLQVGLSSQQLKPDLGSSLQRKNLVIASFKGTDNLENMYDLLGRAYEETQKGAAFRLPKTMCVAQEPT